MTDLIDSENIINIKFYSLTEMKMDIKLYH